MVDIEKIIKDEFLNINNKKVKNEDVYEYLTSLKNEELTRLAITQVFVDRDFINLFKVKNLNNRPKKFIIEYVIKNLDKILKSYIKIIKDVELEQLKLVMNNNGKKIYIDKNPVSIHFINFLKTFSLAKVEYNKKDDSIKIFIPDEFIKIFKSILNNKKILEINKYNNKIFDYCETVINTYGIVTLGKLHEIFESQMFKIDIDELNHVIESKAFFEEINIYLYNGEKLICNLEFYDEDFTLDFYDGQKIEYRKFSKEEYKLISDGNYVDKLKSYKKFVNYLCNNYIGINRDIEYIKEFIVNDYIYSAQINVLEADNNFIKKIHDFIEMDEQILNELLVLIRNIYKEYPKWSKRGNC